MRIIAKAKPIRIRIKSGGEEHSSLDSLRRNLCVEDLWPLIQDKRLSRWLMQLGEVELAHEIEVFSEEQLDDITYFKFLYLFLKDELEGQRITELYSLFSYWHDSKKKESMNYKALRDYLLGQYNGAKFLYRQYADEISEGKWWDIFCLFKDIEDPEFLFAQGKLAFDGYKDSKGNKKEKDIVRGKELIEKAAELNNQEAISFMESNDFCVARKLAMLTPEAKEKIDRLIDRWKDDTYGFQTRKTINDEEIVREVKSLLQDFASFRTTFHMFTKEAVKEEVEAKYSTLDESSIFYKERQFVLDLTLYSCYKSIPGLFEKLAKEYHYPLAQYMLHRPDDNRIDGFAFAATMFPYQLRFIVDHLFKY